MKLSHIKKAIKKTFFVAMILFIALGMIISLLPGLLF